MLILRKMHNFSQNFGEKDSFLEKNSHDFSQCSNQIMLIYGRFVYSETKWQPKYKKHMFVIFLAILTPTPMLYFIFLLVPK